jgi:predicted enzyme related to lactoylglutathione lyase
MPGHEWNGHMTISMSVKDYKKASAWYQKVLGFKHLYDVPDIGWCEVASPTANVNIGLSQVESPKVGAGPVPVFGVNDIDASRAALERQQVKFDGPTQTIPGMVKLATFYDADGNALMLFQSLAGH